jgi:hypothetical protein
MPGIRIPKIMGWEEHVQTGTEIFRSDYWVTAEGIAESCNLLSQKVQDAIANKDGLWKLVKPGLFNWYPLSPIECSCEYGFSNFLGEFRYQEQDVDQAQELLKKFDTRTIIAGMVFAFERVGLHDLLNTQAEKEEIEKIGRAINAAMTYAESQDEAIKNMATLLSETESWQLLQSVEGRTIFFIEPVQKVIGSPQLLEKAIERVRTDWGDPWNKEHKVYQFSESVALSLRLLFQDKLNLPA